LVDIILELGLRDQKMVDELAAPFTRLGNEDFNVQYRRLAGIESSCDEEPEIAPTEIQMIQEPIHGPAEEPVLPQGIVEPVPELAPIELTAVERQRAVPETPSPPPIELIPDEELIVPVPEPQLEPVPVMPVPTAAPLEAPAMTIDLEESPAAEIVVPVRVPALDTGPGPAPEGLPPIGPVLEAVEPIPLSPIIPTEPLVAPIVEEEAIFVEPEHEEPNRVEPAPEPHVPDIPLTATDQEEGEPVLERPRLHAERFSYLDYMQRRRRERDTVVVIAGVPPNTGAGPPPIPRKQYPHPLMVDQMNADAAAKKLAHQKRVEHSRTVSLAAMTSVILGFSIMGYAMYELAAFDHSYY
jgi:hypothetical protein